MKKLGIVLMILLMSAGTFATCDGFNTLMGWVLILSIGSIF